MSSSAPGAGPLLNPDEPAPYRALEGGDAFPCLLICDHASRRIPRALGNLGLEAAVLDTHLACDIGAGRVVEHLSRLLGVPALLCEYSRLVIDCNRSLDDPTAFLHYGDGVQIHGNAAITEAERQRRADEIYWPYHSAIASRLVPIERQVAKACLISIHSFSPVLDGKHRPWDAGVLWDTDPRLALPVLHALADAGRWRVGDNEPYSGRSAADFSVDYHAEGPGRPHLALEIRQDHIGSEAGAQDWAERIAAVLRPLLSNPGLYEPYTPAAFITDNVDAEAP